MGSARLPGKPLADIAGLPLVVRVLQGLEGPWRLCVATDSEEVVEAVESAGYSALLTGPAPSGTHRVADAWRRLGSPGGMVVNLQGDEPQADASWIRALASVDPGSDGVVTLARRARMEDVSGPESVKVVTGASRNALYFSRCPIPWGAETALEHVGAYAFSPKSLVRCTGLKPSALAETERLEQLAWLEAGVGITVVTGDFSGSGVDTEADLMRARAIYASGKESGS